ncbi:hypothetical protein WR25_22286 [Diploscapter pachys]|uniref:G-protein coupled receptors family 1 profile domain-containing protein n=1 Tax=Diploscapter pachys TaxID=2018661 RepID=A0A2A2JTV0_9BILA|nr:hypothetical protein WR25_22286 [Diploscapter pachys]
MYFPFNENAHHTDNGEYDFSSKPRRSQVYIALVIFSAPSVSSFINLAFMYDDPATLREIALKTYPNYYIDAATITGFKKVDENPQMSFSILFICAAVPATYQFIFFLRHKILKRVEERQYSETTKRLHFDLLKYLNHPFTDNLIFFSVAIIPVISPFVSFFFIAPYKEQLTVVCKIAKCKKANKISVDPNIVTDCEVQGSL